jgi:DNA-binding cell septation regulator SpoVG
MIGVMNKPSDTITPNREFPQSDKNWYFHPVTFLRHIEETTEERCRMIQAVQDIVVAMPMLKQGHYGMYPEIFSPVVTERQTYCNHAVFLTIHALDKNYTAFTGGKKIIPEGSKTELAAYPYFSGNWWCDILNQLAGLGDWTGYKKVISPENHRGSICCISAEEAHDLANSGYVVIGAWKNFAPKGSPHFVTVRPKSEIYNNTTGSQVAHVGGGVNGIKSTSEAFSETRLPQVRWYYNREQQIRIDLTMISSYRWRGK